MTFEPTTNDARRRSTRLKVASRIRLLAVPFTVLCLLPCLSYGPAKAGSIPDPPTTPARSQADLTHTLSIPLENGRLELGTLLGAIADLVGLDGQAIRDSVHFGIDVHGTLGRAKIKALASLTNGIISITVDQHAVRLTVDRLQLRREEKRLRTRFRALMENWFPLLAAKVAAQYGLWVHTDKSDWSVTTRPNRAALRLDSESAQGVVGTVVLVHGLDDPGKVWRSLIPELLAADYRVIRFEYPNDQPIADSADMLANELAELRKLGIDRLSLVAHSMGGLLAREVLTNPTYHPTHGADDGADAPDRLPAVDRLIMIGTPNHGSQLARLRLMAEVRDQLERAFSGDGLLFGSVFDGAGEAKIDLLPDSDFLTELNARPHPQGVKMTIIAGIASPVTAQEVDQLTAHLGQRYGENLNGSIHEIGKTLRHVVDGVGDGLVSMESTRLKGVEDHQIVGGNHLSMIRNFLSTSDRLPPAVPIVLDRLSATD